MASWTVDGGGYVSSGSVSSGAVYTLTSTLAQADAGQMTGDRFSLGGGFWGTAVSPRFKAYLPFAHKE